MALPSATMARKVGADVPQLAVPNHVLDRLDAHPDSRVDLAVELVRGVRDSNAFDGTHLLPINRYHHVAAAPAPGLPLPGDPRPLARASWRERGCQYVLTT